MMLFHSVTNPNTMKPRHDKQDDQRSPAAPAQREKLLELQLTWNQLLELQLTWNQLLELELQLTWNQLLGGSRATTTWYIWE